MVSKKSCWPISLQLEHLKFVVKTINSKQIKLAPTNEGTNKHAYHSFRYHLDIWPDILSCVVIMMFVWINNL